MIQREKFTAFEGFSLLCTSFLFNVFSGVMPELSRYCGNAGWLALIFSAFLSIGYFFLFYWLLRINEGKDLLQINRQLLGPFFSKIVIVYLLLFVFLYCANNLFEAVKLLSANTYSHTRTILLAIAFLSVVWVIGMYPIKGFARTCSIAIWLFLFSITIILILSYNQYDAGYLTPIFGYGLIPITKMGFLQLSNYQGLLLVALFATSFDNASHFRKSGLWAVGVANLMFISSALFFSMSAPYQTLLFNRAGLLDLAQSIYINRFFQRLESVFIIFVCMGKILVLGVGVLACKRLFAELFRIPPRYQKPSVFPLLIVVLGLCQMMFNLPLFGQSVSNYMRYSSLYVTLFLLVVWLTVSLLRRYAGGKRAMVRATSLLLVCCLSAGTLSGCNMVSEPDEEIFAIVMGYDKSGPETLRITMKIMPEDKNSAGGSGGGFFEDEEGAGTGAKVPNNIFTVDAPCNIPAVDLINTVIPKHLSLLHVKMLVISEELAREDIDMLITPIIRYNEIKSTIAVVVCEGAASDYIAAQTSELIPFLPLETEMILKRNKGNSSYLVRQMREIYETFSGNYGDALVMYGGLTKAAKSEQLREIEETGKTDIPRTRDDTLPDIPGLDTEKMSETIAENRSGDGPDQKENPEAGDAGTTQKSADNEDGSRPGGEDPNNGESTSSREQSNEQQSPSSNKDSSEKNGTEQGEELEPEHADWEIGGNPGASVAGDDVPYVFFDDPELGYLNGYLPGQIPIKTAVETQIAGMAVLRGKQMVGTLNTHETKIFMLADGSFEGAVMIVRDPYKPDFYVIYYAHSRQKNRIKTRIDEDGKAYIDIELFVQAELAIVQNTEIDYQELGENEKLRKYTKEFLEKEIEDLVFKLQKVYQADSLRLGRYVSNNFLTIQDWEDYNWPEKYPDAEINVTVDLRL